MRIKLLYVPSQATVCEVTHAIASVVHSEEFAPERPRLLNFKVELNPSMAGGVRNDGSGWLFMPSVSSDVDESRRSSQDTGRRLLNWAKGDRNLVKVRGKSLRLLPNGERVERGVLETLDKTPYVDPDIEEERQHKLYLLSEVSFRVHSVQVGTYYQPSYLPHPEPAARKSGPPLKLSPRSFSVEWECKYTARQGWFNFELDHQMLQVDLGDVSTEQIGTSISIPFHTINKLAISYDFGTPCFSFDLLSPPILEEVDYNRTTTGNHHEDSKHLRRRISSLDPRHAAVAPYAHQLRVLIYQDSRSNDVLTDFKRLCDIVGILRPIEVNIESYGRGFFNAKNMKAMAAWLQDLPWEVAFQIETILRNALLNTEDLLQILYIPVNALYRQRGAVVAGQVMRYFTDSLRFRPQTENPLKRFEAIRDSPQGVRIPKPSSNNFLCAHVTITPTRFILEGPYSVQSNRIIRQYPGYEQQFIRVDFREEDRLQYRWARETDGRIFLADRVGNSLKDGFEIAGRQFQYLCYSSSALRQHAVWMVNPFIHPEKGAVDADAIRQTIISLGDELEDDPTDEDYKLKRQPSKFAARLAQAFTATDPSVRITREQWCKIPDLGRKPYEFTDGVGTISRELGALIWAALQNEKHYSGDLVEPSAYQIRFLGYKGVVAVDPELEGIMMCLRPSMRKFRDTAEDQPDAPLEIARSFERPNVSYLNNALVMILEDREVNRDVFMDLQEQAVAEARQIDDSLVNFRGVLRGHSLGGMFRLPQILERLEELGLDLHAKDAESRVDTPFLALLRRYAMNHVLRDIKHSARIPIPNSHLLVGITDEGPAYQKAGHTNVFTLPEGHIFACVQKPNEDPLWLKGQCSVSRSPVVHPGDIQRVYAVGKPPEGQLCLFRDLKNVVVFSSDGPRSLPSQLGGGDVDGDLFDVIMYSPIHPQAEPPAQYPAGDTWTLNQRITTNDIIDFIVEYIKSDVLGLLSTRHLTIADQSKHGTRDAKCLKLAGLCSQAVDYPKMGIPVDIDSEEGRLPGLLIRCRPDWQAAEMRSPRKSDYYTSNRALGHLYRAITLEDPADVPIVAPQTGAHFTDPITTALQPIVESQIEEYEDPDGKCETTAILFNKYRDELRYICLTHTLSNTPGTKLTEEEVVIGTIMAQCTQRRWRKDCTYRMRTHASELVKDTKGELIAKIDDSTTTEELQAGLKRAWTAWDYSLRIASQEADDKVAIEDMKRAAAAAKRLPPLSVHEWRGGGSSFGLIALAVVFDCLKKLDAY